MALFMAGKLDEKLKDVGGGLVWRFGAVRSSMTVGCDCDEEMVARGKFEVILYPNRLGLVVEVEEPQLSMAAAAAVAEAMVAAEGGRGWL